MSRIKKYNCKWCHVDEDKLFYNNDKTLCKTCKIGIQKINRGNLNNPDSKRVSNFGYINTNTKVIIKNNQLEPCDKCTKISNIIQNYNNEIDKLKMEIDTSNQIIMGKDETIEELNDIIAEKDKDIFQLEISNSLLKIEYQNLKSNSEKINTKKSKAKK